MNEVSVLRKQVKQFVDDASERELEIIYHLFEATNKSDWWDEITQTQRDVIDQGIKQLDSGKGISHKEVMKKYSKWLRK